MTSHTALRGTKKRQDLPDQLFPEQNDQGNGDHGRDRILQQRMHGNMKKKDTEACERPDNNGREQAFF